MTIQTQEDYIAATNRFFSLFPLYQANVSKILIDKARHSKDGASHLHLFDLSHLNLKTKRIFLIDLYDHQKRTALVLRLAILDNTDGYQLIFVYVDNDYYNDDIEDNDISLWVLNSVKQKLEQVASDVYNLATELSNKKDITLDEFLNNSPIYQSFLSLLNDNNYSDFFPNTSLDAFNFNCGELDIYYPEIYIISPDNTAIYNIKRDSSSNIFEMVGYDRSTAQDTLPQFYYHILKCVFDNDLKFPDIYLYDCSLNYANYSQPYFIIDNDVYYCGVTNDSSFAKKTFADNSALPDNFDDFHKNRDIAFRDMDKFIAYQARAKQILKDYEIKALNDSIVKFDYEEIKDTICKKIDLAADILNNRNEIIKRKLDTFNDIEVI